MDKNLQYEAFLRGRITELREKKGVSEHRMSLDLGRSGSYIRSISSGASMPSVRELFNILLYFEVSPSEFFAGLESKRSLRVSVGEQLLDLNDEDLEKVSLFIRWIQK